MEYLKQLRLSRQLIHQVLNEDGYLNILLSDLIKKEQLDDQTRKFITSLCYGVVENKLLLAYYLRPYTKGKRVKPLLKITLLMAIYGLFFMKITNHHFGNVIVEMVKKEDYKASTFVNYVIRQIQKDGLCNLEDSNKIHEHLQYLSIRHSIPFEIVELLYRQYPQEYEEIINFNKINMNVYRINLIKTTVQEVDDYLSTHSYQYKREDDVLWCEQSLINTSLFINGQIVAQDYASQLVARATQVQPNMLVVDACSAPGSKAMHLAQLMNNQGKIIAMDIYPHKLAKIEENAEKLGVKIVETLLADATDVQFTERFDVVLLDVPCSGIGVMHHKPDLKYRITLNDIKKIEELQARILKHMAVYVKEGGVLVYSTCTINQRENQYQIAAFLEKSPFVLLNKWELLPSNQHDGFAIYQLQRKK